MKLRCPACERPLPPEQVNVRTDLALCAACGELSRVSELPDEADELALGPGATPPRGAWHRPGLDSQVFGATTRSWGALFLVPFTLVWSGFSLGGIYGSQIKSGEFNPLLCLFGLPFLIGSIALVSFCAMSLAGKVELRLRGPRGEVFTGVGPVGWRRRFDLGEVTRIDEEPTSSRQPNGSGWCIVLHARERLKFGSGLNDARRDFILRTLRAAHRAARR